jgi:hypothetical protein
VKRLAPFFIVASIASTACMIEPMSPEAPVVPQSPENPQTPGMSAAIVPPGVYRLIAPITHFDPAWEDLTGYQYSGIFEIRHDPANPAKLSGSFSEFTVLDATGKPGEWITSGTIAASVDSRGSVTLELKNIEGNFTWSGKGTVRDGRIDGMWGRAGHLAGPFSAQLEK